MTDNHNTDNFNDELLSAYVDGELTGDQLAQVEQRLVVDPQAAQLVEELRVMSQELQALPTERVGEDLRVTIMQRAERAMLLGTGLQGTDEPHKLAPRASTPHRRWIWAAFALAASLMLAMYLPTTQREEQPLAKVKPAQGGETAKEAREVPRMEAVTTDEPELDESGQLASEPTNELEARPVPAAALAKEKAMEEQDASAMQRFAIADQQELPAESTTELTDEFRLTCTVHLTLSDQDAAGEQFEKDLAKNGIAFQKEVTRQAPEREVVETNTKGFAARSQSQDTQRPTPDAAESEQLVYVEASPEQIEDALEDFNTDTNNYLVVDVKQQLPSQQPLDRFQQWNRTGKQLAQNKLRALKREALAAKKATQGWATRLDPNQYQGGRLNYSRKLLNQQNAFRPAAPQPPIQVLFILQRATGESASADGPALKAVAPDR